MQNPINIIAIPIACSLLLACATEKYEAKPINVAQITAKILAKDIGNADFKAYLIKQGYQESTLPFTAWGLDELTLCALYFNPQLDVAKAQQGLANAQIESAGVRQNPTLNGSLARSNQKNGDIRPWAYGLTVEIPIETANKRSIKIEEAEANAAVSRMDIASTAWQLRSQIAKDLLEYHQNIASTALLQSELAAHADIVTILKKRVDAGLASNTELGSAKLAQLKVQSTLNDAQSKSAGMLARLASDIGLSVAKFEKMRLKPFAIDTALDQQTLVLDTNFTNKNIQESALLNRIDIRRSLAKYAAAEAHIKLEVAKQTPDISISPGYIFEFGDSVWSLGFSSLLNLLNKNPTLINEAKQLREIEGAQFEALQAHIIGDLNQTYAEYEASKQHLHLAQSQYTSQLQHQQKLQKQFNAGLIDHLELKQNLLSNHIAQQQVLAAQFDLLNAANNIENVMQAPLYSSFVLPKS